MVTKGLITSIDYNGNTCEVRIPLFETVQNTNEVILPATIAIAPGVYNGYKEGDVVIVTFEDNNLDNPIVIGKLYLGAATEKASPRGAINCETITSDKSASMPLDTKLVNDAGDNGHVGVENNVTTYSSIADIAKKMQTQSEEIGSATVKLVDTENSLEAKVSKEMDATITGFGWSLEEDGWRIISYNSALKFPEIDIMKVDNSGVTIAGTLKLVGYPRKIEKFYLQTDEPSPTPSADDPNWSPNVPAWDNGKFIWEKTVTTYYEYNPDTKLLDEKTSTVIVCITGAIGESARSYWLVSSTPVHVGKNATENISIKAMTKLGETEEEDLDDNAYLSYKWDVPNEDWTIWDHTNTITIAKANIQAADLLIRATHDDPDMVVNPFVYEEETITYSPLNTPIIDLTNDRDVIKYAPNGTKLTGDVSSTAQVYLGGSPEAATYSWTVKPVNKATIEGGNTSTVTVKAIDSSVSSVIITCEATTTNFKKEDGTAVKITKDFTVLREVAATTYWIKTSTPVHTGNTQQAAITAVPMIKVGNDAERPETGANDTAYLRYRWHNENATNWPNTWSSWTLGSITISNNIQEYDLEIQATHTANPNGSGVTPVIYDEETITYSPLNTPVVDLTNDNASIPYNTEGKIGSANVESTAALYLNGLPLTTVSCSWSLSGIPNNATGREYSTRTVTNDTIIVKTLSSDTASATCTITVTDASSKFYNKSYSKTFTVSKQFKGEKGDTGVAIKEAISYYQESTNKPERPKNNQAIPSDWSTTAPSGATTNVWMTLQTIFDDDNPNGTRHITYTDPIKDEAYALAQGKTTNYYSYNDPGTQSGGNHSLKHGDCWFCTGYKAWEKRSSDAATAAQQLITYTKQKAYYQHGSAGDDKRLITEDSWSNVNAGNWIFLHNVLLQWDAESDPQNPHWVPIDQELVANKVTANYINALDITAKKITVVDPEATTSDKIVFKAEAGNPESVRLGTFGVDANSIHHKDSSNHKFGYDDTLLFCTGTDGPANIGGSGSVTGWNFTAGTNFGIRTDPTTKKSEMYVDKGKIGGFTIDGTTLSAGKSSLTDNNPGLFLSAGTAQNSTCGIALGTEELGFRVSSGGDLKATSGTLGNFAFTDNGLKCPWFTIDKLGIAFYNYGEAGSVTPKISSATEKLIISDLNETAGFYINTNAPTTNKTTTYYTFKLSYKGSHKWAIKVVTADHPGATGGNKTAKVARSFDIYTKGFDWWPDIVRTVNIYCDPKNDTREWTTEFGGYWGEGAVGASTSISLSGNSGTWQTTTGEINVAFVEYTTKTAGTVWVMGNLLPKYSGSTLGSTGSGWDTLYVDKVYCRLLNDATPDSGSASIDTSGIGC